MTNPIIDQLKAIALTQPTARIVFIEAIGDTVEKSRAEFYLEDIKKLIDRCVEETRKEMSEKIKAKKKTLREQMKIIVDKKSELHYLKRKISGKL